MNNQFDENGMYTESALMAIKPRDINFDHVSMHMWHFTKNPIIQLKLLSQKQRMIDEALQQMVNDGIVTQDGEMISLNKDADPNKIAELKEDAKFFKKIGLLKD